VACFSRASARARILLHVIGIGKSSSCLRAIVSMVIYLEFDPRSVAICTTRKSVHGLDVLGVLDLDLECSQLNRES